MKELYYQWEVSLEESLLQEAAKTLGGWHQDFFLKAIQIALKDGRNSPYGEYVYQFLEQDEKVMAAVLFKGIMASTIDYVLTAIGLSKNKKRPLLKAITQSAIEFRKLTP